MEFTTQLVGVLACTPSSTFCNSSGFMPSAPLYTWTWKSNWNGTSGGIHDVVSSSTYPGDPGSGTGGVTVTSINGVQLPDTVPPSQVAVVVSGLVYRGGQSFLGKVTLRNASNSAVNGPLQILFPGLPFGVTVINATGTFPERHT